MAGKIADFTIIKKLGDGAYSSVFKVRRHDDNEIYALKNVKMLSLSEKEKENALNEVRILASIDHPNVIAYRDAFIDESTSSLCLVMEYADNGDVFQKICNYQKRQSYIKEKKIWYVFIQIVRGLRAFHQRKILHRDMKSANLFLFKDMQAKLGDLNVSKVVQKGLSYTQTGTPYYASPEVWKDMPYDSKSDIWSLGCVLYEMCALVPPFRADDMQGLYKKVIKGKFPRIPDHFSQEMATVIKFMLQISPNYRPSCDQILALPIVEALSRKFFPEEKFKQDENESADLLRTIRISRNLFSLTERLPKSKYRGRSNDLMRNNSVDSNLGRIPAAQAIQNNSMVKVKNLGGSQLEIDLDSPDKGSRQSGSRPHMNQDSEDDLPAIVNKNVNREGTISKPRNRRESHPQNQPNRTPSLNKGKEQHLDGNKRKLTQSPSLVNMPTQNQGVNSDDGGFEDDQQPTKPIINNDYGNDNNSQVDPDAMPLLANKHRQIGNKKGSVNVISDNRLLGENESQNSANYGQSPRDAALMAKGSGAGQFREHRGSAAPRIISRVRGDKIVQGYQNQPNSQIQKQHLYGKLQRDGSNLVQSGKLLQQQVGVRHRNKSTVRGGQIQPLDYQGLSNQGQQMLKRNNSKPQLQLPEIGVGRHELPQGREDNRQQRLVSARSKQHAHLSPISQVALNVHSPQPNGPAPISPNKIQHIFDVIDRKSGKNLEKIQQDMTRIYMMQVNNKGDGGQQQPNIQGAAIQDIKKRPDGEWGTLPAAPSQRNGELSPLGQPQQQFNSNVLAKDSTTANSNSGQGLPNFGNSGTQSNANLQKQQQRLPQNIHNQRKGSVPVNPNNNGVGLDDGDESHDDTL